MSTITRLKNEEDPKWISNNDQKKESAKKNFFDLIGPMMMPEKRLPTLQGLMPSHGISVKAEKDKIHTSLGQRNIEKIDFSPIHHEEHGPHALTHFNDVVHNFGHMKLHHASKAVKKIASIPMRGVQILALGVENAHSDHVIRDTAIDLGLEEGACAAIAEIAGVANIAGLTLLASHAAQQAKTNWPGPSTKELGRLATSQDSADRKFAQEWLKVKAGLDVCAFPAEMIHKAGHAIKNALNENHWPGPSMKELGRLATSQDPVDRKFAQEWLKVEAGLKILSLPVNAVRAAQQALTNCIQ